MKVFAEFLHDWQFLYARCNWIDFTLIELTFEDDRMFGNFEVRAKVMGIGFRLVFDYAETATGRRVARDVENLNHE